MKKKEDRGNGTHELLLVRCSNWVSRIDAVDDARRGAGGNNSLACLACRWKLDCARDSKSQRQTIRINLGSERYHQSA
jgi:hypothetical protein